MADAITVESLLELCKFLLRRADYAWLRIETMRRLLHERGVFSETEFEQLYEQMRIEYFSDVQHEVLKAAEKHNSEKILELLRSFEGTKQ